MKKMRTQFKKMKEGFLTGKVEKRIQVYMYANFIFMFAIYMVNYIVWAIIGRCFNQCIGVCLVSICTILLFVSTFCTKIFFKIMKISSKIIEHFFDRYGLVVSKEDWKRIKKENNREYKFIWDKRNIGHCYAVTWILARHIEDAKIMYCSCKGENGQTAHAVIVKNHCIYDTNDRKHFDYDEYIKMFDVEVYQIYEKEQYCSINFFNNIRQGFVDWCAERNVHCNPE